MDQLPLVLMPYMPALPIPIQPCDASMFVLNVPMRELMAGARVVSLLPNIHVGAKDKYLSNIDESVRVSMLTPDNTQKDVNGHNKTAGGFVWKFATPEELQKTSL